MSIPGTNSTAVKNPDGTWNVMDVPIVHEGSIPRFSRNGEKVDEWEVTRDWMQQIISVHAMREREGYMGRSFVDHHGASEKSQPDAGYIRPTRIGTITIEGERKDALMADLIAIPDEVYQTWIKTSRMPYRSIESLVAESGFVDGLALMPTRPPHFQLPMLTIGNEVVPGGTRPAVPQHMEAVACASASQAEAAVRRTRMSKWLKAMDEKKKKDLEEGRDESPIAKSETGDSEPSEDSAPSEVAAEDIPAFVAELRGFADSLEGTDEVGEEFDAEPVMEDSGMTDQPVAEQPMSASRAEIAKAEAKADAAAADAREVRKMIAMRDAVDDAVDRLADYNLGSNPKAHLMAKAKEHGIYGLNLYVETVIAHAPKSPGSAHGDGEVNDIALADLPKEVMAYTEPNERAAALRAYSRWQEQERAGWDMGSRSLTATIDREIRRNAGKTE